MPGSKDILLYDRYKEFADKLIAEADVICCLDFNALSRIDAMADAVAASKGRKMMVNKGLDYHHCKGCLRCVEICPTQALVSGVEREHSNLKWFIRNKDLIVEHMDYEDVGANSWITSDSFLEVEKITEVKNDGKTKDGI